MVKRERGFTLLETVVAMAIFAVFLAILFTLTSEMRGYEKRLPISMQKHPQMMSVIARVRRDVEDGLGANPYLGTFNEYEASPKVLLLEILVNGGKQTIVWDFRTPGEARRRAYNVGLADEWVARGLPAQFIVGAEVITTSKFATRLTAKDQQGRIAIDTIIQPRATE